MYPVAQNFVANLQVLQLTCLVTIYTRAVYACLHGAIRCNRGTAAFQPVFQLADIGCQRIPRLLNRRHDPGIELIQALQQSCLRFCILFCNRLDFFFYETMQLAEA